MASDSALVRLGLFALALVIVAFPLMAVSFYVALELAPLLGADLRGSLLGSVVGGAIILFSVGVASMVADTYLYRLISLPEDAELL